MTARQLALRELSQLRKNGAEYFGRGLASIQNETTVSVRDKSLAERIFTGTYQNLQYLDYVIAAFCRGKYSAVHPLLKDILRLSAYQIVFLDRIPHSAAVNEGVQLARKKLNPGAAGMANAVLRKISTSELPLPPNIGSAMHLSVLYSHPQWLAENLIKRIGYDRTADCFRLDNQPAPITIQINTIKIAVGLVFSTLDTAGISYQKVDGLDDCFIVTGLDDTVMSLLKDGHCFVQDLSARMCVVAASPKEGDIVIDACAAPGGKSFSSAVAMKGRGRILSCDLSASRLERLVDGAARLGIDIITTKCCDASLPDAFCGLEADVVIVDAPCSGFGTIRKKPEIRNKAKEEIIHLPSIQTAILSNCAKSVKPGGTLVYSTCTVFEEENEDVVNTFLEQNSDFSREEFILPEPFGKSVKGMLTIWPCNTGSDGFFIAKMRRK